MRAFKISAACSSWPSPSSRPKVTSYQLDSIRS
jgi:hypothetical protein